MLSSCSFAILTFTRSHAWSHNDRPTITIFLPSFFDKVKFCSRRTLVNLFLDPFNKMSHFCINSWYITGLYSLVQDFFCEWCDKKSAYEQQCVWTSVVTRRRLFTDARRAAVFRRVVREPKIIFNPFILFLPYLWLKSGCAIIKSSILSISWFCTLYLTIHRKVSWDDE